MELFVLIFTTRIDLNKMVNKHLLCLFLVVIAIAACSTKERQLRSRFNEPLPENRPNLNTHHYPHDPEKQDSILDNYLREGYGGMAANVNWTDDYLKNEKELKSYFRFVRAAKSRGMNVWLYDENWYPSGMAGGYILEEHPEWEAEGLLFKDSLVSGPQKFQWHLLPGNLLSVKAVPVIEGLNYPDKALDITEFASKKFLEWEVPAGTWRLAQLSTNILREGFQAGNMRGGKDRFYPSLLMPEVTRRFIELTHKKYAEAAGEKLGNLIYATFTDEPSSMGHTFQNLGYGVYPWKKNLSDEIYSRFGWKPEDKWLTIMFDEGNEGKKLRYQYFSLVSEFMSRYHFRSVKEYCNSQGIKASGHLLLEESLPIQALLYGDIMACYREMDIPGIDVLTGMPEFTRRYLYSSRMAASAAELNENTEVMSEICPIADKRFHNGKEAPTNDVKGTINRQMLGGVTRFNNYLRLQHASQKEKMEFNSYVARISTMMNGGFRASSIAVLYPIETIWTKFRPAPAWNKSWDDMAGGDPNVRKVSEVLDSVADHLYANRWEFSYIDVRALVESKVTKGKLCHGSLKWDLLVLPGIETLSLKAMETIRSFVNSGGKVLALKSLPENSPSDFPSIEITSITDKLFKNADRSENTFFMKNFSIADFQASLEKLVPREYSVEPSNLPVLVSHKIVDGHDVLLVVNDSSQQQKFSVSITTGKIIEKWNPNNGEIEKVKNPVKLSLNSYDGIILRY
jgi:hypothetical protein